MARKKAPELDGESIARAIEKDLPGWNLAKKARVDDSVLAATSARAQPGTTLSTLRKKFLGEAADATDADPEADSSDDTAEDYGALDDDQTTVQVEPKEGGASKVADVVHGKVKIVQG